MNYHDIPDTYELEVMRVVDKFVGKGDHVIDAGASVGFFTRMCSRLVGNEGRIFSFEPNLESFVSLEKNVKKYGMTNVQIFRQALWSKPLPEIRLWSVAEIGYTSVCQYINTDSTSEVVEAVTLDDVIPADLHVRFMKIDCELAEFEILRGAKMLLQRGVDCVVLEFNYHLMKQNGISDHIIRDYMADFGYDMFLINIGGSKDGEFSDPVMVGPKVEMEVKGQEIHHMNVMFSKENRVRELWAQ